MPSNPTIIAAAIGGAATVLAACITVIATGYHLTPTSDTREFQKTKQENVRLTEQNQGLKAEIAGLRQENTGLKQQNASLNDEIAQARSEPPRDSQPQEPPALGSATQRVGDFVSHLDGCHKSNSGVTCVVRVMNTKEDRVVRLYNDWTSIVDSTGNEQKVKIAKLGASTSPYAWMYAETTLPTNIAVRATLTFGRVDSDVTRLSILTLGIQCLGVNNGMPDKEEIQFRAIPLPLEH